MSIVKPIAVLDFVVNEEAESGTNCKLSSCEILTFEFETDTVYYHRLQIHIQTITTEIYQAQVLHANEFKYYT